MFALKRSINNKKENILPSRDKINKSNFNNSKLRKVDILFIYLLIVITLNIVNISVLGAETIAGDSTYSYLSDSIFGEHEGANGVQAQIFMSKAAMILKWILPAMNVLAVTLMVISFAATIVFLAQPDFWTDVHMLKVLKSEIQGSNPAQKILEMWRRSNGVWNFVKSMLPDVKMIAFYDAGDIGEDGVPSLKTFFKHKIPKYMMIVALIMCVNDQTLLDLITRGGEAGAYLVRRGAEIDYAAQIKSFVESGKDFDPGYRAVGTDRITRNKKILFDKIYGALKKHNGIDEETITEEYKNAMGSKVKDWVEEIANQSEGSNGSEGNGIDLSRAKINAHVTIQPAEPTNTSLGVFVRPVVNFSPKKADSGYVVLTVSFSEGNRGMTYHETTDPNAWTTNGDSSIQLDLSKVSILSTLNKDGDKEKKFMYSVSATVKYLQKDTQGTKEKIGEANVNISDNIATITAPSTGTILGVTAAITVRNDKGIRLTNMIYTYWKNPDLSNLLRDKDTQNTGQ